MTLKYIFKLSLKFENLILKLEILIDLLLKCLK